MPLDPIPWPENPDARRLLRAATYIEDHGWCQHAGETDDGRVCAVGAIARTCPSDTGGLLDIIENHVGAKRFTLPAWNDAPGRTKEEVIAALRGAAEALVGTAK